MAAPRYGGVARVDFSMIEALLWTMAEPLLGPNSTARRRRRAMLPSAIGCMMRSAVRAMTTGSASRSEMMCNGGRCPIWSLDRWRTGRARRTPRRQPRSCYEPDPSAALASSVDLVRDTHLCERGFWDVHEGGVLPGFSWRASFGRRTGPAPALGADSDRCCAKCSADRRRLSSWLHSCASCGEGREVRASPPRRARCRTS